jgi:hypothetical protein
MKISQDLLKTTTTISDNATEIRTLHSQDTCIEYYRYSRQKVQCKSKSVKDFKQLDLIYIYICYADKCTQYYVI